MSLASPAPFYPKPWLDYAGQVALLASRGLIVADPAEAEAFLSHVNYYRFSGYCLAFEIPRVRHRFAPGITFEQVRSSYQFDLLLRDLLNEALEIIEVDLRAVIAYRFGQTHHAFGHTNPASFDAAALASTAARRRRPNSDPPHLEWLKKLRGEAERSKERFVQHFQRAYREFPDLPIWVLTEVMNFGALSMMFQWMQRTDKAPVAQRYGVQPNILESWMHHFVYVRNLCAHHCRLWDRNWSVRPMLPPGSAWHFGLANNQRLACTLLILYRTLLRCPAIGNFASEWKARVEALIATPPQAPNALDLMGMIPALTANSLWK